MPDNLPGARGDINIITQTGIDASAGTSTFHLMNDSSKPS
jgi:hypothetical protein